MCGTSSAALLRIPWVLRWWGACFKDYGSSSMNLLDISCPLHWSEAKHNVHLFISTAFEHTSWVLNLSVINSNNTSGSCYFNHFYNIHFHWQHLLSCCLCAQKLKQAQKYYQKDTLKSKLCFHLLFYNWIFLNILLYFFMSLILTTWEILLEYRLITCFPNTFGVFFSFFSLSLHLHCLYSSYVLVIVSLLDLSFHSWGHYFFALSKSLFFCT